MSFLSSPVLRPSEAVPGRLWENGSEHAALDVIANETAVALVYNGMPYVVMMATPGDIEDFVLGFSLSEGIIKHPGELFGVRVRTLRDSLETNIDIAGNRFKDLGRKQRNLTGRIGCGLCGAQTLAQAVRRPQPVANTTRFAPDVLQHAMASLAGKQPLFAETGAVHAAAWVDARGSITLVREDVGRHNALDKLIGAMVTTAVDFSKGAALITSRASSEMIQKAATVGMQIVCAVSAPTVLAVRMAEQTGVTLIAFARGNRHTVYAHADRLETLREPALA